MLQLIRLLITDGPPMFSHPKRLPPEKLKAAKASFSHMLQLGIIRSSKSRWSSPLHLGKKKSDDFRPTDDYRWLNAITIPDRYPLPHLQNDATSLPDCTIFLKTALIQAYYPILVNPIDIPKTATATPIGSFEFLTTLFGLKKAAGTFRCFIDEVVHGLDFVYVFTERTWDSFGAIFWKSFSVQNSYQRNQMYFQCAFSHFPWTHWQGLN